jgi:predicted ATPase/DNA-binding SARP family transcriptional activator
MTTARLTTFALPSLEAPRMEAPGAPAELPVHLTRFIGRERELSELARLFGVTRLLTLTGAGGSGKTRLAREAAAQAASAFARVAWVDLAPLADPSLLTQEVAAALHLHERPDAVPTDSIIAALCETPTLLVLDNCEHMVDACAELVELLLLGCPRVTVLATSREALSVPGETAWLVPPLVGDEAAQLFVERARASLPSFALTEESAPAVREICHRLDGIPLAIELAAARVRVLSPEQIAARLDDAFRLLTSGSRTALPRHRTLRGMMDWSYALLGEREQALLRRLAVFAGSFSLDAAEAICVGAPVETEDTLDAIAALVDKSLLVMEPGDTVARYRFLETVRQYGLERLREAGELDAYRERHALHFVAFAEEVGPHLVGGEDEPGVLARAISDHDNLRAGCAWALSDSSRAEEALRFAGALFWYWYGVGQFHEARHFIDQALALEGDTEPAIRGRALVASGLTALAQGDYPTSRAHFASALPLLRAAGDVPLTAVALAKLGAGHLLDGDAAAAEPLLDEAHAIARQLPLGIVSVFVDFWRGWAAYARGRLDFARSIFDGNYRLGQQLSRGTTIGHSAAMLGRIEFARGNLEEACVFLTESIQQEVEAKDAWGLALAADVVAAIAATRGRYADAARMFAGIDALRERSAMALPGADRQEERARMVASLHGALGAEFDRLWTEGRSLSMADVASLTLAETARHTAEHRVPVLDDATPAAHAKPDGARRVLRVLALGPLQVFLGDDPVDVTAWGSARPRELLVYLLMHPEGRTKEQVGLAFWPEASAAQLRNNFHVTLHRLRKALRNAESIMLVNDRYRVDPEVVREFDVIEFERDVVAARRALKEREQGAVAVLERAVARFHGDFLDGEPVGDWHVEHRERLQRLYVDALTELGGRLMEEERWAKAADAYRRVLARDDLHEEAARALMRCHARLGERAQALRLYEHFAERLRGELGAQPDSGTTALYERVRRGGSE